MKIDYDPAKNQRNIVERGLSFDRAAQFNFTTAIFRKDTRCDYNEVRNIAVGYLDARLHIMCFVETEHGIRVISFRKANKREAIKNEKPLTID